MCYLCVDMLIICCHHYHVMLLPKRTFLSPWDSLDELYKIWAQYGNDFMYSKTRIIFKMLCIINTLSIVSWINSPPQRAANIYLYWFHGRMYYNHKYRWVNDCILLVFEEILYIHKWRYLIFFTFILCIQYSWANNACNMKYWYNFL